MKVSFNIQMFSLVIDDGDLDVDIVVTAAAAGPTRESIDIALAAAEGSIRHAIADGQLVTCVLTRRHPSRKRAVTDGQLAAFLAPARVAVEEIARAVRKPCGIQFTLTQAAADGYGVRIQITGRRK